MEALFPFWLHYYVNQMSFEVHRIRVYGHVNQVYLVRMLKMNDTFH